MISKTKIFIFSLVILTLILPRPTFAFIGTGMFDYSTAALEGVEEPVAPIVSKMVLVFFLYGIGLLLLGTSSLLLNYVISHPEWLDLSQNAFVSAGFNFTLGLANMFLILIFIVIAFLLILKVESFQAKKVLPRLIIVALLLNFSLLFVKMAVDISNVLYSAIMENTVTDGQNLVSLIFDSLIGKAVRSVTLLAAWIGSLALSFSAPFVGPFFQLALATGITLTFLPNILTWVFQLILMFLLSGILFLLTFFFGARIFLVQILAIFTPLAFLCLILPQTEKYWKEWLNHLVEWLFFGLISLFLLVLGLRTSKYLIPGLSQGGAPLPFPRLSLKFWEGIDQYFIYYFFLFIYFVIITWFSKKNAPVLAKVIIDETTNLATRAFRGVIKPWGKGMGKQTEMSLVKHREREEKAEAARNRIAMMKKQGLEPTKQDLDLAHIGPVERASNVLARGIRWTMSTVGRTTPETEVNKDIESKKAKMKEKFGKDTKSALAAYPFSRLTDSNTKIAMGLYLSEVKGEAGLNELSEKQQRELVRLTNQTAPHRLADIVKNKPKLIQDGEVRQIIQNTIVPEGMNDKEVKKLVDIGIEESQAILKATYKKVADALKLEDIENLSEESLKDEEFQEAIIRFKPKAFIRKIGEEKGPEYVNALREKAERLGAREVVKTNPTLLRSTVTDPGFRAIFPPLREGETLEQIKDLETKAKDEINKKRTKRIEEEAKLKSQEEKTKTNVSRGRGGVHGVPLEEPKKGSESTETNVSRGRGEIDSISLEEPEEDSESDNPT